MYVFLYMYETTLNICIDKENNNSYLSDAFSEELNIASECLTAISILSMTKQKEGRWKVEPLFNVRDL